MKCELCNEEVKKGDMNDIETMNLKFYVCDDCMLYVEDKIEDIIKRGKK